MSAQPDSWIDRGGTMIELLTLLDADLDADTDASYGRIKECGRVELQELAWVLVSALYSALSHQAERDGQATMDAVRGLALAVHESGDTL